MPLSNSRWLFPALLCAASLSACFAAREDTANLATLRGAVDLGVSGNWGDGIITPALTPMGIAFSLSAAPGHEWDTAHCPVLADDVRVTVNGIAAQLLRRGGSGAHEYGLGAPIGYSCDTIDGVWTAPAAVPTEIELVFADSSATISTRSTALLTLPTMALASGQAPSAKPGDTVRLALTPATDVLDRSQILFGASDGTQQHVSLTHDPTAPSSEYAFVVPQVAAGAAQIVLDQPSVGVAVESCVGAVSCSAVVGVPGYEAPPIAFAVVGP